MSQKVHLKFKINSKKVFLQLKNLKKTWKTGNLSTIEKSKNWIVY